MWPIDKAVPASPFIIAKLAALTHIKKFDLHLRFLQIEPLKNLQSYFFEELAGAQNRCKIKLDRKLLQKAEFLAN